MEPMNMHRLSLLAFLLAIAFSCNSLFAQAEAEPRSAPDTTVLDQEKWKQVDTSVKRGLEWLISQQNEDGSFETIELGQPAITSFCLMAFLAQGESPVDGKYREQLSKAIDYIADQQKPNGLLARIAPSRVPITRIYGEVIEADTATPKAERNPTSICTTAVYNHAISALALCEVYGQCSPEQTEKLAPVVEKAVAATLEMQRWKRARKQDVGGWRYLSVLFPQDSDLSITGWQLMFLRSARNAGFDVPAENIETAVKYVERCFLKDKDRRVHSYDAGNRSTVTRAVAGAGILAMAHAGKPNSDPAVASGEWILENDFKTYDFEKQAHGLEWLSNRYHYGAFLCTAGMYQLGGKFWNKFFPTLVESLLENQLDNGAWSTAGKDRPYGHCYTTSLCILSLSVPNQMLPIFQR
jgi:hypothetical protein